MKNIKKGHVAALTAEFDAAPVPTRLPLIDVAKLALGGLTIAQGYVVGIREGLTGEAESDVQAPAPISLEGILLEIANRAGRLAGETAYLREFINGTR